MDYRNKLLEESRSTEDVNVLLLKIIDAPKYNLRDMSISLKAKVLLPQTRSLPEGWDYTLSGLAHINREKKDAIREAVKELECAGYFIRSHERCPKGRLRGADYVIYEHEC